MTATARAVMGMILLAFTASPVLAQVRTAPPAGAPAPAGSVGRLPAPPPPRTPSVITGPPAAPGLPSTSPHRSAPVAPLPPAVPPPAPSPARTPSVLTPGSSSQVPAAAPPSVDDTRAVDPRVAPTIAPPTDPRMGPPPAPPKDPRGGPRSMAPISADPHAGLPYELLINPATGTILDPTLTKASPTVR